MEPALQSEVLPSFSAPRSVAEEPDQTNIVIHDAVFSLFVSFVTLSFFSLFVRLFVSLSLSRALSARLREALPQ